MPVFISALGGMLINLVGTLVGRVLVALGLALVTYTGVNATLDFLKNSAVSSLISLPPEMLSIMGVLKVGVCISIVTSAVAARLVLDGLTGGTFKRWVNK